jgi:multidrug transporter EmrE-like cation transporter
VSVSVQLGLVLSLATAFVSILGFLYKHRGAVDAPEVQWRTPVASTRALFANKWWTIGILVAMGSWVFHVAALALAPITLVQTVIAGGLVLLTVVADRLFGLEVSRREWIGVALTAVGLAILAATLGGEGADSAHNEFDGPTLALYVGGLTAASGAAMVAASRIPRHAGVILAAAAGLQWGGSDVSIKALTGYLEDDGVLVLLHPLALVILVLSLVGLVVSARSLQIGDPVPVIAVTSAAANLSTIASGLVVFGEPLPEGTLGVVLRLAAFGLVIGAAALTPAPMPVHEERAAT